MNIDPNLSIKVVYEHDTGRAMIVTENAFIWDNPSTWTPSIYNSPCVKWEEAAQNSQTWPNTTTCIVWFEDFSEQQVITLIPSCTERSVSIYCCEPLTYTPESVQLLFAKLTQLPRSCVIRIGSADSYDIMYTGSNRFTIPRDCEARDLILGDIFHFHEWLMTALGSET